MPDLGFTKFCALLAALLMINCSTLGQEVQQGQDVRTRELWDSNLLNKRPAGKAKRLSASQDDALVGITLWRLRPSVSTDSPGVRSLIHDNDRTAEWTPERIKADALLHEDDKVRISIETARTGYLYVIDSDEYQDGTKAEPYLIFPTLTIRGGDNAVGPGKLVEIPTPEDVPPYFRMRRSRPDQRRELLTIIVSPKPIEHLQIGRQRLRLSAEQVSLWREEWQSASYRLEAYGQTGKPYTLAEKTAGKGEKELTQDDPLPQTMYHLNAKPGEPLMIDLSLQVSE